MRAVHIACCLTDCIEPNGPVSLFSLDQRETERERELGSLQVKQIFAIERRLFLSNSRFLSTVPFDSNHFMTHRI